MISMARTLGAPETVPAGKPGDQRVDGVVLRSSVALDVRDDVHHVASSARSRYCSVTLTRADLGDAADIVAAEIEQHQVLGALLGIGEQLGGRAPGPRSASRRAARAGDRADRHLAVAQPDQDLRATSRRARSRRSRGRTGRARD